jgi:DNA ligase 1
VKIVQADDVRSWHAATGSLAAITRSIGRKQQGGEYLEQVLGVPHHLRYVAQHLAEERGGPVPEGALDSIPFYSLCRALFLPLSSMAPERAAALFGIRVPPPEATAGREALLARFLGKEIGLSIEAKLGCVLGDPFLGKPSTFRRDSLIRLLLSVQMVTRPHLLDRLAVVGDVAVLFAESRGQTLRSEPPLTAAEVLETLRLLPRTTRNEKFDLLRSLLSRTGRLEAYFLAKLLLRKAGFGFDYQGPLLARSLAERFGAPEEQVAHAAALTDIFHVARVLATEGAAGLRKIQIQPLVPLRPALASGTTDEIKRFPVWVERKYDGIRLMLHRSEDTLGQVLCGAYTRGRHDWLELVLGLDATIKLFPARRFIVDGELFGTTFDLEGSRPASVYELYAALQGDRARPVNLRYAAFDLVYLNGRDLTALPLSERRQLLQTLCAPLAGAPLPVPVALSEGQLAASKEDVNRLYHHFRAQGYEGVITKDLAAPYALAARDPGWLKRKPEVTLDLVLLGAVYAVTTKEHAGLFGSYVIGARRPDGSFEEVGDVAGVDKVRDAEIQGVILRDGLVTGRRIERASSSGVRPGLELRPEIVVTVKFEGIARDLVTGKLALRDPKLAVLRADKPSSEADATGAIEEIYLRQRVG